jgi:protein-tyrosine phosphatase
VNSPVTAQARVVPLEGGRNFRDLGGYVTVDGRHVRWRRLFRSGTLAQLTPADHAVLSSLGVRAVCDLRTTSERQGEPSSWAPADGRVLSWDYELDDGAVMGAFRVGKPTAERVRAAIAQFYLTAPEDFADRLRELFKALAARETPLIMHCTAGKDRTGMATAIVLRALGVPAHEVVEDYAMSSKVVDYEEITRSGQLQQGGTWAFLSQLSPDIRAPLIASEPAYIQAMLDRIDAGYGSVDGYLARRVGVEPAAVAQIRDLLLESG